VRVLRARRKIFGELAAPDRASASVGGVRQGMAEAAKPPTNCLDIAVRILAGVLVLIIATLITIWTDSLPCRLLAYAAVAVGLTAFLLKQFRVLTGPPSCLDSRQLP